MTTDDDDDDSSSNTVDTDDSEFSEFIASRWKDRVEVGLVINYPLPHTDYLSGTTTESAPPGVVATRDAACQNAPPEAKTTLPPLALSTVLPEGSIAPLFDGTQWAGTRVWKAAVLGLEHLLRERASSASSSGGGGGSLLELGCGLGVPGMVWKQVLVKERERAPSSDDHQEPSPQRVVLTDRDSLLSQLQSNVKANFPNDPTIEAKTLDWSREGITALLEEERERNNDNNGDGDGPVFDVCLNCDCVYEPLYGREAWESLADVLETIALASPETLLVTALERRNGDNAEGFLARLEASGVVETPIERVVRHEEDPHHVIEIYATRGKGR